MTNTIKFEVSLHLAYCAARRRGVASRPRAAPAHLGVAETGLNKTELSLSSTVYLALHRLSLVAKINNRGQKLKNDH